MLCAAAAAAAVLSAAAAVLFPEAVCCATSPCNCLPQPWSPAAAAAAYTHACQCALTLRFSHLGISIAHMRQQDGLLWSTKAPCYAILLCWLGSPQEIEYSTNTSWPYDPCYSCTDVHLCVSLNVVYGSCTSTVLQSNKLLPGELARKPCKKTVHGGYECALHALMTPAIMLCGFIMATSWCAAASCPVGLVAKRKAT